MPSTYSELKIELIATGEQTGTWGSTTNVNLGTALEEAITGSADVTFASNDITLTWSNTNASQEARHLRLNLIGTTGGSARNLIVPTMQKLYLINNTCGDAITVKNSTGTGIVVGAGKTNFVYNDGSNVVDAVKLGTMSEQNDNAVDISGGEITGLTNLTTTAATIGGGDLNVTGLIKLNGDQGTVNQYLGSNAGADPTWQTIPAAAVVIPAGTRMLFQQTAAPTGWVKQTTYDNYALRVVSGTATTGGTVAFTTAFTSYSVAISGSTGNKAAGGTVANHTLSNARIPSHTHVYAKAGAISGSLASNKNGGSQKPNANANANSGASGGSQAHNHGFTGAAHNHTFSGASTVNVDVLHVDVIIATKS
jgi:hypothetical protein